MWKERGYRIPMLTHPRVSDLPTEIWYDFWNGSTNSVCFEDRGVPNSL